MSDELPLLFLGGLIGAGLAAPKPSETVAIKDWWFAISSFISSVNLAIKSPHQLFRLCSLYRDCPLFLSGAKVALFRHEFDDKMPVCY